MEETGRHWSKATKFHLCKNRKVLKFYYTQYPQLTIQNCILGFFSLDLMLSILTTSNNNNNNNNRGSERKFSYVIKVSYDLDSSDDFTGVK